MHLKSWNLEEQSNLQWEFGSLLAQNTKQSVEDQLCTQGTLLFQHTRGWGGKHVPTSKSMRFEERIISAKGPETALSPVKNDFQMPPALGIS